MIREKRFSRLQGLYLNLGAFRFILLREGLDRATRSRVLCHELGHDVLHADIGLGPLDAKGHTGLAYFSGRAEQEADAFSAEVRISDGDFLSLAQTGYTLEQIARTLEVDPESCRIKAEILRRKGYPLRLPD